MQAFAASLAALCVLSLFIRDGRVAWTAMLLLANWMLCSAAVLAIGENDPWILFASVDAATAAMLILVPAVFHFEISRVQIVLLLTYAAQLLAHGCYGLVANSFLAESRYYWILSTIAWVQLILVAGWGLYEIARAGNFARWHLDGFRRPKAMGEDR